MTDPKASQEQADATNELEAPPVAESKDRNDKKWKAAGAGVAGVAAVGLGVDALRGDADPASDVSRDQDLAARDLEGNEPGTANAGVASSVSRAPVAARPATTSFDPVVVTHGAIVSGDTTIIEENTTIVTPPFVDPPVDDDDPAPDPAPPVVPLPVDPPPVDRGDPREDPEDPGDPEDPPVDPGGPPNVDSGNGGLFGRENPFPIDLEGSLGELDLGDPEPGDPEEPPSDPFEQAQDAVNDVLFPIGGAPTESDSGADPGTDSGELPIDPVEQARDAANDLLGLDG